MQGGVAAMSRWMPRTTVLVTVALLSGCSSHSDPPGGVVLPPPPSNGGGATLGGLLGSGDGGFEAGVETPDGGAAPGAVAVSWAFPGLLETAMGAVFPTYLAHLFGKKPRHPLLLELACVK